MGCLSYVRQTKTRCSGHNRPSSGLNPRNIAVVCAMKSASQVPPLSKKRINPYQRIWTLTAHKEDSTSTSWANFREDRRHTETPVLRKLGRKWMMKSPRGHRQPASIFHFLFYPMNTLLRINAGINSTCVYAHAQRWRVAGFPTDLLNRTSATKCILVPVDGKCH